MRAILIGAGRGRRLMPTTADAPKCFARIGERRILDWVLSALRGAGLDAITFIGGYRLDAVRASYPDLDFVENPAWAETNILGSLMCAREHMHAGFVSTYADIVYRADAVERLLASPASIALLVDTAWRPRYEGRTEHPPSDAEKVCVADGRITRVHRDIDPDAAYGEFTGVARFDAAGAAAFLAAHDRASARVGTGPFREAPSLANAYLIHLLQEMVEDGIEMTPIDTPGGYWEIDTQQDFDHVRRAHAAGERWG